MALADDRYGETQGQQFAAAFNPAQAQKLFGALADRTHSFDQGLVLAAFLPLLAVLPLWWCWGSNSDRSKT